VAQLIYKGTVIMVCVFKNTHTPEL